MSTPEAEYDLVVNPEELRDLADRLERRAEQLLEERIECQREARDFRHRAEMIETRFQRHVTVSAPARRRGRHITARDLDRVQTAVEALESPSTADVADRLNITHNQARERLKRLEEIGTIYHTGIKATVRWFLKTEDDDPRPPTPITSYREQVRDIGCELGTFTRQEIVDAGLSYPTVVKWTDYWVARGTFEREKVGREVVYAVRQHESEPVNREQRVTPEQEAVREVQARGMAIAGAGRQSVGSSVVDALIREVAPQGVTIRTTKHKVEYVKDGRVIANSSKTPGASHLGGTRKQLRDAGVRA